MTAQASPQQLELQTLIAEQTRILDSYYTQIYYTQIKVKSEDVEAIWQDLIARGTEAGQGLALLARQRSSNSCEMHSRRKIVTAQATSAYRENQEGTSSAQARSVPVPTGGHSVCTSSKLRRGPRLRASLRAAR